MPSRVNPLQLNPLQLRTLTILQILAAMPEAAEKNEASGETTIKAFPDPHGDHFHLGDGIVMSSDITGLFMESVWNALQRKGLAKPSWPTEITLTREGLAYETGLRDKILHSHGHGNDHGHNH
jgi:hypothetical protein